MNRIAALPDFPWDSLRPYRERARLAAADSFAGLVVDLSVGTPVDATPWVAQRALQDAADAPGYPLTVGTSALREAIVAWFARRRQATSLNTEQVFPTLGSKEMVAWLPTMLGLGPGDTVLLPEVAYPTYAVGAILAGATAVPVGSDPHTWPPARLAWINSPGNPHGEVWGAETFVAAVEWARRHGAVLASDECYAELAWEEPWASGGVPSLLADEITGGDYGGLLALYSLSKQSNLAGYRAAFIAGDVALISRLTEVRKHAGMIVPAPVQAAMVAVLADDEHVAAQREEYRRRRELLQAALLAAGADLAGGQAGLYLWAALPGPKGQDLDCWEAVGRFADLGIVVTPGDFYGRAGKTRVRIALTAPLSHMAEAAGRISAAGLLFE